ncbi:hypothetical protein B0T20DRAFT_387804, partial [Sordaria brevicollis]
MTPTMTSDSSDDTAVNRLIIVFTVMATISGLTLGFRYYCKHRYAKQLGADDLLLGISYLILCAGAICSAVATRYGFGYHIWAIHPPTRAITAAKIIFCGGAFVFFGIALAKTSICLTLYNISTKRWQKWTLVFVAVTVLVSKLLAGIFVYVSCTPLERRWNPMVKGKCWDIVVLCRYWSFSGYAALDLVVWECAELAVAITVVSVPFSRLAVQSFVRKKRAQSGSKSITQASRTQGTNLATSESKTVHRDGNGGEGQVPNTSTAGSGESDSMVSMTQFLRTVPEIPGAWRESGGIIMTREFSVGRHRRDLSEEEVGGRAWSAPPSSNV